MDFWAGTLFVVLFALLEVIIFFWFFGGNKAWEEINRGGLFNVPKFYFYVLKYITPLSLFAILAAWSITMLPKVLLTTDMEAWIARFIMVFIFVLLLFMIYLADKRKNEENPAS
jgi:hypothetical protein